MKKKTDKHKGMSRRKFLREPVLLGGSAIALSALGGQTLAQQGGQGPAAFEPHFDDDQSYRRRGHSVVMTVNENLAAWARKSGQPFRTKSTARPSDSASQTSAGRPYPLAHRSFQRRSRSRYNGPSLPTG